MLFLGGLNLFKRITSRTSKLLVLFLRREKRSFSPDLGPSLLEILAVKASYGFGILVLYELLSLFEIGAADAHLIGRFDHCIGISNELSFLVRETKRSFVSNLFLLKGVLELLGPFQWHVIL